MDLLDLAQAESEAPVELTIDAVGVAEDTYGRKQEHLQEVVDLLTLVASKFTGFMTKPSFKDWEMIGFTKADGITYFEDTVSVVYRGFPWDVVKDYGGSSPESVLLDYYVIKYQLQSLTTVLKCYDSTFGLHPLVELPYMSRLLTQMGVGVHFGSEVHEHFRDVYFVNSDVAIVKSYCNEFGLKYPKYDDDNNLDPSYLYGFGVTYDSRNCKPIKMKRYFFPHDPSLSKLFAK